ncbi:ArsR/SmtB family transcription factor [Cellulosilyticum sp. I15G10I2]|uniref:ArsR/SmtB family transcription factor n=1 Tax=Cellulosilyticum sp. I15G10I2 TaxID=1892843 RepID=UPI00085C8518|nr:helix-turn-helix domain-containing protein [Cellulosilyticum sp. I15G10I2]
MREISNPEEIVEVCKALGSTVRMNLVRILSKNKQMNLNELASKLNITNGAMTQHMKILVDAGLIDVALMSGKRGSQKICHLKENRFIIDFLADAVRDSMYQVEIPVGSYTNYSIYPTCGLSTKNSIIGEVDDPRYFDAPERSDASIIWLGKGFVEYRIPNYLKSNQKLTEIQISLEISSEAPGYCEEWPSDVYFYLNEVGLGYWTSPGDFGTIQGIYTPSWWSPNWNQHGLLKLLSINKEGSFIDGRKISDMCIDVLDLNYKSDIILKIAVPNDAENVGGLTIFGKGFGNYNQHINARMIFE